MTLDKLTKEYIHSHLEYQYCVTQTSQEAFEIETAARSGDVSQSFSYWRCLLPSVGLWLALDIAVVLDYESF